MKKVFLTSVAAFSLTAAVITPLSHAGVFGNLLNDVKNKVTGDSSSKNDPSPTSFLNSILNGIKKIAGSDASAQSKPDGQKMMAIKAKFCKKGNFFGGDFSLRSFEGRLCRDEAVAALYLSLCPGQEGFSTSQCYKNARTVLGDRANDPQTALKQTLTARGMSVANLICSGSSVRALFASTCAAIKDPAAPHDPINGITGKLPQVLPRLKNPPIVHPAMSIPTSPIVPTSTSPAPIIFDESVAPPPLPPRTNEMLARATAASAEATAKAQASAAQTQQSAATATTPPPLPSRPATIVPAETTAATAP